MHAYEWLCVGGNGSELQQQLGVCFSFFSNEYILRAAC